jgi:hypothetical protein
MPVVLMQHFLPSDRVYADVEGSLYHYPRMYFSRIKAYDFFVYYRPLGESAPRRDSKTYFGYGLLGEPFADVNRPDHRFVQLLKYEAFPNLVPLKDPLGNYYETGTPTPLPAQAAVRAITDIALHRILAAAGTAMTGVSRLPSTDEIAAAPYFGPAISYPKDGLRVAREIPPGAGYRPQGDRIVDVYESAALQERARADHQRVLKLIAERAHERGGSCWYNNNIDLFVECGESRILVEAKSLNDPRRSVDRMRYGLGQLTDYGVRYREEVGKATKLLAFGRPPEMDTSWVGSVLQEANIGFVAADGDNIVPLNDSARSIELFR